MTLAAIAVFSFANAQLFVGGSLGFSSISSSADYSLTENGQTITINDVRDNDFIDPATTYFNFAPKVGFYLNEKLAVGLELGFNRLTETEYRIYDLNYNDNPVTFKEASYKTIETVFSVGAFGRYHFAEWNNFSLFAELSAGVAFGNEKTKSERENKEEINDGAKIFGIGIGLIPGVSYKINEHIQLEATLDLFGLNYNYTKTTMSDDTEEIIFKESAFDFGADSESLFNVGQLTVGFVYKF